MNSPFFLVCLLMFGMIQLPITSSAQTVWYVSAIDTGNGASWATATSDLQEAIDSAGTGDQIWIAGGTYYPTVEFDANMSGGTNEREKTFYINKNIQIYGGFNGTETHLSQRSTANVVILSGDIDLDPQILELNNAYQVMFLDGTATQIDSTCLIDGLIIQDGYDVDNGGEIGYEGPGLQPFGFETGALAVNGCIIDLKLYKKRVRLNFLLELCQMRLWHRLTTDNLQVSLPIRLF